jgi:hypothetical protein
MQSENLNADDNNSASLIRSSGHQEKAEAHGFFTVKCFDKNGKLKWEDVIENVVTTVGKNAALDAYLAGSAYTVTGPLWGL